MHSEYKWMTTLGLTDLGDCLVPSVFLANWLLYTKCCILQLQLNLRCDHLSSRTSFVNINTKSFPVKHHMKPVACDDLS